MPKQLLEFKEERVADLIDELKPLFAEHWRELALYQEDIPLDPDYDVYLALDKAGVLAPFIVRKDGAIIGYAVYLVRKHPHYRSHTWALADLFWVHPDHRNAGVGTLLFENVEAALAVKGVDVMHTTIKEAHPEAGFLLNMRGHVKVESGFSKRLR
jgi:GNAT superfamily N-acetyltransferase